MQTHDNDTSPANGTIRARFIYKPIEITRDHRLTATMQDYLCLIAQLEKAGGCTASNKWFAEYFGVSRHAAIDIIRKLREAKFIESKILKRQGKKITLRELSITDNDSKQSLLTNSNVDGKQSLPGIVSNTYFDSKQTPQEKTNSKTNSKTKTFRPNSDEFRLSELLLNLILERKPDFKKPNLQSWAKDIDKMIRLDSRKPETIEKVIQWSQADDFWQNNILSADKLRKQFDKLELKSQGKRNHGNRRRDFSKQESNVGKTITV